MRLKHACIAITTCATPDLLLKHLDVTIATYKKSKMKHLKKTPKKHLKHIGKHTQHPDKTLATYV
jgi:hypothetical protein